MIIKTIIPVRSGSMRVKNKNIRPFASSSLLEIKIEQMKRIKLIDEVIVNSNSDEMLEIAKKLGVTAMKREERFAGNDANINEFYSDTAQKIDCDLIMITNATNPMIKDETIENLIELYFENDTKYDSVVSANSIKEFLWKDNKPINYDPRNKPRSQDLPEVYAINYAFCIMKRQTLIDAKDFVGFNPLIVPIEQMEGVDIDTEVDFEFAEFLYKKYRMNQ